MSQTEKDVYQVLIADDSEDDRFLLKTALRHAPQLRVAAEVADGAEAIAYLGGRSKFRDRRTFPLPHLLLLDLKMPVQDGFTVLEWLNTQSFERLMVVILTDSMEPAHIKRALDLGADRFQVKPTSEHERHVMILALEEFILKCFNPPAPSAVRAPQTAAAGSGAARRKNPPHGRRPADLAGK